MRFALFIAFIISCLMAIAFGVFGNTTASSVLGAIWSLVAVVAMGFRGVLDALRARERGAVPATGEPASKRGWFGGK